MAAEPVPPQEPGRVAGVGPALDPTLVGTAIGDLLKALSAATGATVSALFTPTSEFWDGEPPETQRSSMRARAIQALETGHAPRSPGYVVKLLRVSEEVQSALCLAEPKSADVERIDDGRVGHLIQTLSWQAAAHHEVIRAQLAHAQYEHWFRRLDEQVRVLDRERQKFAAIVHGSDAWVFVTDLTSTIRWTNTALSGQPSKKGAGWVGRRCEDVCADFHGPLSKSCDECPVACALEQNRVVHREFRGIEDGRVRSLYLSALPIKGLDGKPHEAMVMVQDLSNLQVEERLQTVVSNLPIVLFSIDRDGAFTMSEGRGLQALELKPGEVVGRSVFEMYKDTPQVVAAVRRALEGEEFTEFTPVGKLAYETTYTPVRDAEGTITGLMGVATDVTDRKVLEERLRHAQRMEAIGRLAGGVAHDFNNLLSAILGHSELALSRIEPGHPMRRNVEEIQKAGTRGSLLTRQLLAFSRKDVLTPTVVDMNVVVLAIEGMLRRLIGEDIELAVTPAPGPATVRADRGQLEQIVMNLAVNARDAMPRGGRLTIGVQCVTLDAAYALQHADTRPGPYVQLSVGDNGCGMDAETLSHVFEPFYTTKDPGKGTGLGLSTVYGIAQQNQGHVTVYSEPGMGATFKVYFPQVGAATAATETTELPMKAARGAETVLLVEDEDPVRSVTREVLESNGYKVIEARNGFEALEIAASHGGKIDIVVTDVVMPVMGGAEMARRLVAQRPGLKVLYMSGYTDDAVLRHGVLEKSAAFLQKPFPLTAFVHKVREVLDGDGSTQSRAAA
jgi:PAS domain S-box-containing protein